MAAAAQLPPSQGSNDTAAASSARLTAVVTAVGALTSNLLAGVVANGTAAIINISTPAIQLAVGVAPSGANSSLATAGISAPGAASSFDPLPLAALAAAAGGGASVTVTFAAFGFNPYPTGSAPTAGRRRLAQGGAAAPSTGMTRLVLGNATGANAVANLTAPVTFSLPSAAPAVGQQGVCSWWDPVAGSLSTAGCLALPSPAPPGHSLAFTPGFYAPNDTALVGSWTISGSLAANCTDQTVFCSASPSLRVWLDPTNPFASGAVACPAGNAAALRVFSGPGCGLWQPGNALRCFWNGTSQAFQGPGCVVAPTQRCSCRHLTDYVSGARASQGIAFTQELTQLTPQDVFVLLRPLLLVVFGLFALTGGLAALGVVLERRQKRRLLRRLQQPEFGFRESGSGAWTWSAFQAREKETRI